MKRFYPALLAMIFCCLSLCMNAQTSQIATLSHNGEISIFPGTKGFIEAYNAASDGDVITLSAGQFEAVRQIRKNITVRGNGMYGSDATVISGLNYIYGNGNIGVVLYEGVSFTDEIMLWDQSKYDVTLVKCCTQGIRSNGSFTIKAIHSDIHNGGKSISGAFYACHIECWQFSNSTVENCIVDHSGLTSVLGGSNNFKNSIFIHSGSSFTTESYRNIFHNCVYIGDVANPFQSPLPNNTNKVFPTGTQYLKEGTTTFELLDELQTSWLGTDGTQVGMHGGSLPFDPTTTAPQIKKFDVSAKTSADGKLSVDIIVDSE